MALGCSGTTQFPSMEKNSLLVAGEPSQLGGRGLDLGDVSTSGPHREGSMGQVSG